MHGRRLPVRQRHLRALAVALRRTQRLPRRERRTSLRHLRQSERPTEYQTLKLGNQRHRVRSSGQQKQFLSEKQGQLLTGRTRQAKMCSSPTFLQLSFISIHVCRGAREQMKLKEPPLNYEPLSGRTSNEERVVSVATIQRVQKDEHWSGCQVHKPKEEVNNEQETTTTGPHHERRALGDAKVLASLSHLSFDARCRLDTFR